MPDIASRFMAFGAVVIAVLNAGLHFRQGHEAATLFFLTAAVLVAVVTNLTVRRRLI